MFYGVKLLILPTKSTLFFWEKFLVTLVGYEPADLTVHPPPQNCRGWVHFFSYMCLVFPKNVLKRKPVLFRVIQIKRPKNVFFLLYSLKSNFDKLETIV